MANNYDTDLSNAQWELVRPLVEATPGRKATVSRREIVNAILYMARTGCQWRNLPHDFPKWSTVYSCYHRWAWSGTLDKMHAGLRAQVRELHGKQEQPTAAIVDSQSVKISSKGVSCLLQRGWDGAKRLSGRKRFVVCDTLGLWLEVEVLPASVPERKGAEEVFWPLAGQEVCAALEVV